MGTAAEEMGRVAQVVYEAGAAAYQKSEQRRRYHAMAAAAASNSNNQSNPTGYLDDFGIPVEEPLLENPYPANEYTSFDEGPPTGNDFVFLPNFRRGQGWGAVANLDMYLTGLYNYYYHRGLVPIVGKGAVQLITLFGTLFLSVFVSVYLDWKALTTCTDEHTCRASLSDYLIQNPFQNWSIWTTIVVSYILLFLAYGGFAIWSFLLTIRTALESKAVFEEQLGVSSRQLEGGVVEWETVVAKILELQTSGSYQIAHHGQNLDALIIANRILRKENFMVALVNRGLLDLTIPLLGNQQFFSPSIEWSIYFAVLNFMFNHKYQVRPAFYLDSIALKRRFMLCGFAHIIFMPFLVFFVTLHFGLQNAYDWKSTQQYLGPHEWSLLAKWTFREFNELPHHFEKRLAPSYHAAADYLTLFGPNEMLALLGRVLVFFGGGLGTLLVAFAAINDAILLHVKIADWNLLWFAGISGVIYSIGKGMLPNLETERKVARNLFSETDTALLNVSAHTHHFPDTWKGRGWEQSTQKAMSSMFKFKAQLFLMEVASIIVAPYILCVSLARCAGPICEFILATKTEVAGLGEVCGYATFDFDAFHDEAWEGRRMVNPSNTMAGSLAQSVLQTGNVEEARRNSPKPKTLHGKMEKSFFSFKASHPSWVCNQSGQKLVDQVERYKREETAAFSREQQAHIEAAARQLETLARLEMKQEGSRPVISVHESYMQPGLPQHDGSGGNSQTLEATGQDSPPCPPPAINTDESLTRFSGAQNLGLSTELRRILNMSALDDVSIAGSILGGDNSEDNIERRTERQYMLLERYHNHIASQQNRNLPGEAPQM